MGTNGKDWWFHGNSPRVQVEGLVKKAGINGSFAVRMSESAVGAYTLSLLNKGRVFTYRILPTSGKYAIETSDGVQKKKFLSIDELIKDYRKPNNGLACGLTNPVGKRTIESQKSPEIPPALPNRNPTPTGMKSAVTLPLPPAPTNPAASPTSTMPPYLPSPTIPPLTPTAPALQLPPVPAEAPPHPPPYTRAAGIGLNSPGSEFNPVGILAAVTGRLPAALPSQRSPSIDGGIPATPPIVAPPLPPARIQADSAASSDSDSNTCIICYDAKFNAFFQPCGHVCCCMDCAKKLKECPMCRKKISKAQKAFLS